MVSTILEQNLSAPSRSQCRRPVALGTGVRQVNHSEALGGQQDSMAFIKIRLVRLFTALAVKTRKKRAIFTSEETKTTIMLRARKKKEKQTTKFTSVTYVWSWLRGLKELQISYSWNNSESSPKAPYTVMDFLQLNKLA